LAIIIDPLEEYKIITYTGILQFISYSLISNLWHVISAGTQDVGEVHC